MARGRGGRERQKADRLCSQKASEHQRGERESGSVNICLDSAEMVDPDSSQDEEAGHEGEEEEAGDLSDERDSESKGVKGYGPPRRRGGETTLIQGRA